MHACGTTTKKHCVHTYYMHVCIQELRKHKVVFDIRSFPGIMIVCKKALFAYILHAYMHTGAAQTQGGFWHKKLSGHHDSVYSLATNATGTMILSGSTERVSINAIGLIRYVCACVFVCACVCAVSVYPSMP